MKLFSSLTDEVANESPKVEVSLDRPLSFYVVVATQSLIMFATVILAVQQIYPPAALIVVCLGLFFAGVAFARYNFGQAGFTLVMGVLGALSLGNGELSWHAPVFATLVIASLRIHFLLSSLDKKHVIDGSVVLAECRALGMTLAAIWLVWVLTLVMRGVGSGAAALGFIAGGLALITAAFAVAFVRTKKK